MNEKESLENAAKIASHTIGIDLVETKPMSNTDLAKMQREWERARKEWELNHPEEVKARKEWEKRRASAKPHILTPEEREIIKSLLKMSDAALDSYDVDIYNDGTIRVRTDRVSWRVLAGREWEINTKTKMAKLTAMS